MSARYATPRGNAVGDSIAPGATAPVVRKFTSPENGKSVKNDEAMFAAEPTARPNSDVVGDERLVFA